MILSLHANSVPVQLKTTIDLPVSEDLYYPTTHFFMLGSCFTENIGSLLHKYKFIVSANPLGILYNPYSIARLIHTYLMEGNLPLASETYLTNGIISHRDFHSIHNQIDKGTFIHQLQQKLTHTIDAWEKASDVVITLGTAWVYKEKKNNLIVANCHKRPGQEFLKQLLGIDEIVHYLSTVVKNHPGKRFLFTVSPIRHLKDGMIDNARSKSILIESCHQLREKFANVDYFPAYEIMVDDLRDYRFYKRDMIHPSKLAITYIWEKFIMSKMSIAGQEYINTMDKFLKALNHRPFNPGSEQHQAFCQKNIELGHKLVSKYPHLDLELELYSLQNQAK